MNKWKYRIIGGVIIAIGISPFTIAYFPLGILASWGFKLSILIGVLLCYVYSKIKLEKENQQSFLVRTTPAQEEIFPSKRNLFFTVSTVVFLLASISLFILMIDSSLSNPVAWAILIVFIGLTVFFMRKSRRWRLFTNIGLILSFGATLLWWVFLHVVIMFSGNSAIRKDIFLFAPILFALAALTIFLFKKWRTMKNIKNLK
ncbi:hypothetical protein A2917_00150 [Candidatus Nomurabacteria bacterium RIFCSPLOWO2_01_FULL_42_17]|uniref:Uncharacterized protein n=1 Tax=Candidatus Nomurabacteria bacterium RIFCSPLOWO2_01_FULL_42_17 TaxID=1801780 RepID=A0A1F6XNT4_9BACT|nr:MAG: hypothetical protein A2917_00150 [Candidatus Nomurabacteria bacterium RIFCSPLOWO2_01_FULL_42_17]